MFVDHFDKDGCPQGIVALYDKTIPEDEIRAAIDQRYGKWVKVATGQVKVWRVEDARFAIQLATIAGSLAQPGCGEDKGMKQIIYLSFDVFQNPAAISR